jgi:predicted transcriptional regulator
MFKITLKTEKNLLLFVFVSIFVKTLIIKIMTTEEKVLEAMRKACEPVNAGKIAETTGIDKKEVEKAMNKLKSSGSITSPKRCFWEPAK